MGGDHQTSMKVLIIAALCAAAMAVPNGRRLRPEEHWRTSKPRDFSKYQPRHAMFPATTQQVSWEEHMAKINQEAKKLRAKITPKPSQYDLMAECGVEGPPAAEKIVGGTEAEPHQYPWIVALFIDDAWFCGGSLISEDWDDYDLSNDVALIELPSPITFNDYIKPSCLPKSGNAVSAGEMVSVIGWGKPSDSASSISPELRQVHDLPVITNRECNDVYGIVGDGVVCVDTTGGRGSCNGDSGGPLIMKQGSQKGAGDVWTQVGVVSFGASAGCEVGYPAGYSRTEYYLDWIMQNSGIKY